MRGEQFYLAELNAYIAGLMENITVTVGDQADINSGVTEATIIDPSTGDRYAFYIDTTSTSTATFGSGIDLLSNELVCPVLSGRTSGTLISMVGTNYKGPRVFFGIDDEHKPRPDYHADIVARTHIGSGQANQITSAKGAGSTGTAHGGLMLVCRAQDPAHAVATYTDVRSVTQYSSGLVEAFGGYRRHNNAVSTVGSADVTSGNLVTGHYYKIRWKWGKRVDIFYGTDGTTWTQLGTELALGPVEPVGFCAFGSLNSCTSGGTAFDIKVSMPTYTLVAAS